jgi:hypothetical protein
MAPVAGPATAAAIVIGVLLAGLVALAWFGWALLRQNGRLLLHVEAQASELASGPVLDDPATPTAGEPAPDFAAASVAGDAVSLGSLLAPGLPVALVFTDTGCGACERALEEAARSDPDRVTVAVVMRGVGARARERADALGLPLVVHDAGDELFAAFRVPGAPGTLVLDADGRVARPLQMGSDAARDAIASASRLLDITLVGA